VNHYDPSPKQKAPHSTYPIDQPVTIKKNKVWIWKAYCRTTGELVDWECENRSAQTLKKMLDRLELLKVKVFFADNWGAYVELVPAKLLVQTKVEVHGVGRNNFR